jgi:enterochelin esterase-like enzyme
MLSPQKSLLVGLLCLLLSVPLALAQQPGRVEHVVVHGDSLSGNLNGDSPERDVFVYLPPGYDSNASQRYPVVYLLHGYGLQAERWMSLFTIEADANAAMVGPRAAARPMIIVNPSAYSRFDGSFYSSSVTAGNWEGFIADDLVRYVDSHYRTLAQRESRGLAGHSMGGYGTLRIGMKRPDVFAALYPLSAAGMMETGAPSEALATAEKLTTREQIAELRYPNKSVMARAAAWSPNPQRPPLYYDLPVENGIERPEIQAKWLANSIVPMLDQYAFNLQRYQAIKFDVGLQDGLLAQNQLLDAALTQLGIGHTFVTYEGDHNNKIAERIATSVLPFFSEELVGE